MLRLVDMTLRTTTGITFNTSEISTSDKMAYVVYDTLTGASYLQGLTEDYYCWRATTVLTSTGATDVNINIDNTNLYPSFSSTIPDYTVLKPALFTIVTYQEYIVLQNVLTRFDAVRRRMPNPGFTVSSTNNIGQDGAVSFAGGFEKKATITEIMSMIQATFFSFNVASPRTFFYPQFATKAQDANPNPYMAGGGVPTEVLDLISTGALIRCLVFMGLLEIDISFSSSESGLQITFDRGSQIKGWHDTLVTNFLKEQNDIKMNYANHAGVGMGTMPYASMGLVGQLMNSAGSGGAIPYSTIMGFNIRGSVNQ